MHVNELDVLESEIEIENRIGRTTNQAYKYIRKVISCCSGCHNMGDSMSIRCTY